MFYLASVIAVPLIYKNFLVKFFLEIFLEKKNIFPAFFDTFLP